MELVIAACKEAGQHPEGIALYKVGKNPGLFTSKTGPGGEAAQYALSAGYLELLRTDSKAEQVRLTPRGEAYLKEHLDPKPVLKELLTQLQHHQQTMPRWLAEIDSQFAAFRLRSLNHLEQQGQTLAKLIERVEAALRRVQHSPHQGTLEPWQVETLVLLENEHKLNLSDLFHRLEKSGFRDMTIADYHHGVLLLRDRDALDLIAESNNDGPMLEPEYALIDEGKIHVAVTRK
jgi:hypothetical protein